MFHNETTELQGSVARVLNGSRTAAFNGGRSVRARDVCQDEVTLWLTVVLPYLPEPKQSRSQLLELKGVWQCATCSYSGKGCLKSGGRSKDPIPFDPNKYNESKYAKFAHCRNCWFDNPSKWPSKKRCLTSTLRDAAERLDSMKLQEMKKLRNNLKKIVKSWSGRTRGKSGGKKDRLPINDKAMGTCSDAIVQLHGTLELPIKRHALKRLRTDIELRANVQSHMISPRLYRGDTSSIQSLLLRCSSESTSVQIQSFQRWFQREIGESCNGLTGLIALFAVMGLASTSERLTEKTEAYDELKSASQGSKTLSDYLHYFRGIVVELEIVLRSKLDADLTVHLYLLGMQKTVREKFQELYSTQHPGEEYSWRHVYSLNETLKDLSVSTLASKTSDKKARQAIAAIAAGMELEQETEVRHQRRQQFDSGKKGPMCCKCGNETSQQPHPWYLCRAFTGRVAERPIGSKKYKLTDVTLRDSQEGREVRGVPYYERPENASNQYYHQQGFHDTPTAAKHRKMDAWIVGGRQGRPPKLRDDDKDLKKRYLNCLSVVAGHPHGDSPPGERKSKKAKKGNGGQIAAVAKGKVSSQTIQSKMKELFGAISSSSSNEISREGTAEKLRVLTALSPGIQVRDQSLADWPEVCETEQTDETKYTHIAAAVSECGNSGLAAAMSMTREEASRVDEILDHLASHRAHGQTSAVTDSSHRGGRSDIMTDGETDSEYRHRQPLLSHEPLSSVDSKLLSVLWEDPGDSEDEDSDAVAASVALPRHVRFEDDEEERPRKRLKKLAAVESGCECPPTKGTTCASHRSMQLLFQLKEAQDGKNYLKVDETNDTGACLNYMVLDLALAINDKCPECVVDKGKYVSAKITYSADAGEMARVGFIKLKFIVRNKSKQEVQIVRRYELLTKCILQCIHGMKSQSIERGFLDVHAQESSATMSPETYCAREPSVNVFPVVRQANHLELSF